MNVVNKYLEFLKTSYIYILKSILGKNYNDIVYNYVEEYIGSRYLEEKELSDFFKNENKTETEKKYLDSINQIFNYILYLDDIRTETSLNEIFSLDITDSSLFFDENNVTVKLNNYIKEFLKKKQEYLKVFDTKLFEISYQTNGPIKFVNLKSNIKISQLYSSYAINKAFNIGGVNENKYFVTYTLLAIRTLTEKIEQTKIEKYIVDIPESLFEKKRKLAKLLEILNNDLTKKYISFKLTYKQYLKYKDSIDNLIKSGYKISIVLDENFICDEMHLAMLVVFEYVLLIKDYKDYNYIIKNKKLISSDIIEVD